MTNESARSVPSRWLLILALIALVSVFVFLQDIFSPDWPAWVLSPLLVMGFSGAVSIAPSDGLLRAALYQAALLLVPFMGIYGLMDAAFKADWPGWVISPLIVLLLWFVLSQIADAEAD